MKLPVKAILKELEELMGRKNDLVSHKNRKLSRKQLRILYKKKNNPFGPKDQQSQSKAETHLSDSK